MDRREFLGASIGAAAVAGVTACGIKPAGRKPSAGDRMSLRFYPYELELAHTFTVASYSRKTTPGVQVEIDYAGLTGYGEASMPPYLGHTVESVCAFLSRVDLSLGGEFADKAYGVAQQEWAILNHNLAHGGIQSCEQFVLREHA